MTTIVTFSFRYLNLYPSQVYSSEILSTYNIIFKIDFLLSNYLILYFIYGLFKNTHVKSNNTFPIFGLRFYAHFLTLATYYIDHQLRA